MPLARVLLALLTVVLMSLGASAQDEPPVRITKKTTGLVSGVLEVPVSAGPDVVRVALLINSVPFDEKRGPSLTFQVVVGKYIRRLRIRAIGYDAEDRVIGEDEMVVNDPHPPLRVRLSGPAEIPESGTFQLSANVIAPPEMSIAGVDFYLDDTLVGSVATPPWTLQVEASVAKESLFATATVRTRAGGEAHDVHFWGSAPHEDVEVTVQQIPLSLASDPPAPLTPANLKLLDDGEPRSIERVVPAGDLPLSVILLVDSSESMLEELPLVAAAAKDFAQTLARPNQRVAVVGFAQWTSWMTGFTSDAATVGTAVDRLKPMGQTHLYDAVIEMMFELQKVSGRRALIVLTDGVNQGGNFELDHLVHYARYAGVPIYPVIRNTQLTRWIKLGLVGAKARKFASIAKDSGATWFLVNRSSDLPEVYRQIARELERQYLIVFPSRSTGSDQWHSLSLEIPGLRGAFRIPRGYFP